MIILIFMILLWCSYYLKHHVEKYVGIDLEECQFNEKGVFIKGDAYSSAIVKQARAHGPYNLLIDDAWHTVLSNGIILGGYL